MAIYLYVYLEIHVFLFELLLFISFACFVVEEILFSFFRFLFMVRTENTNLFFAVGLGCGVPEHTPNVTSKG